MSSTKKIIAVIGSTGMQGGSVAKVLLADQTFAVRAITRNAESPAAQDLKSRGAEVVVADMEDVESLKKAFRGAYGVFGITDYFAVLPLHNMDKVLASAHEAQHGRNLVDAAEAEGVKHFVWSTLSYSEKMHFYHFESKHKVNEYLKTKTIPRTLLFTTPYFSNLILFNFLTKEGDELVMKSPWPPSVKQPAYDVAETGYWVLAALKNPDEWIGKDLDVVAESLDLFEMADIVRRVTGKKVRTQDISEDESESAPFIAVIGRDAWVNLRQHADLLFPRDIALSQKGYSKAATFEDYVKRDPQFKAFIG